MGRFFTILCGLFICASAFGVQCERNQYNDNGLCYTCPVNATCDGTDFTCSDGFYKNSTICTACPVINSTCTSADVFSCNPGTYLSDGQCAPCPNNATCNGGDARFRCNDGYHESLGQCRACGNHICAAGQLVACSENYYWHSGQERCIDCHAAALCPVGTVGAMNLTCAEGYRGSNYSCTKCNPEYFCPFGTGTNYEKRYCAVGYYKIRGLCEKCDPDTYCVGTYPEHMVCPDGLFIHSNGKCLTYAENDPGTPGACNPGYYDNGTECEKCIQNSTCTASDNFTCNYGYFYDGATCTECPANATCDAQNGIVCDPGHFLNTVKSCPQCRSGYYCPNNREIRCPTPDKIAGISPDDSVYEYTIISYADFTSISSCSIIIVYVHSAGGDYILDRVDHNGDAYQITDKTHKGYLTAPTGHYLSDVITISNIKSYKSVKECTNAPENATYTNSGTPNGNDCPWVCDNGYYQTGNTCAICPDGQECQNGHVICPMGMYADENKCLACPEFYRDNPNGGLTDINQCQIKCDGGTYIASASAPQCTNVGPGFWNSTTYTNYGTVGTRNKCPDNLTTIGYGRGADDASDCGKILHIGNYTLYLRSNKLTSPALAAQYGNRVLYADMTTERCGHLRTELNGVVYSICNIDDD